MNKICNRIDSQDVTETQSDTHRYCLYRRRGTAVGGFTEPNNQRPQLYCRQQLGRAIDRVMTSID